MKNIETTKNEFKVYETARYLKACMQGPIDEYHFYLTGRCSKLQDKLIKDLGMNEFIAWIHEDIYAPIDAYIMNLKGGNN